MHIQTYNDHGSEQVFIEEAQNILNENRLTLLSPKELPNEH